MYLTVRDFSFFGPLLGFSGPLPLVLFDLKMGLFG